MSKIKLVAFLASPTRHGNWYLAWGDHLILNACNMIQRPYFEVGDAPWLFPALADSRSPGTPLAGFSPSTPLAGFSPSTPLAAAGAMVDDLGFTPANPAGPVSAFDVLQSPDPQSGIYSLKKITAPQLLIDLAAKGALKYSNDGDGGRASKALDWYYGMCTPDELALIKSRNGDTGAQRSSTYPLLSPSRSQCSPPTSPPQPTSKLHPIGEMKKVLKRLDTLVKARLRSLLSAIELEEEGHSFKIPKAVQPGLLSLCPPAPPTFLCCPPALNPSSHPLHHQLPALPLTPSTTPPTHLTPSGSTAPLLVGTFETLEKQLKKHKVNWDMTPSSFLEFRNSFEEDAADALAANTAEAQAGGSSQKRKRSEAPNAP